MSDIETSGTKTITLPDGYRRPTKNGRPMLTFRHMRGSELLTANGEVWFRANDGTAKRIRFNGAAKTWKTRTHIERPVKYGLRECGRVFAAHAGDYVTVESGNPVLVLVAGGAA